MSELRTSVVIDLAGNLERRAQRYGQALGQFSRRGNRHLGRLSRTAAATGRALDRAANRYTALLTGAGAVATGRMLVGLEERFTRLGIQANRSADEINGLKREIYDAAQAPDVRVDPGEITSAIEAIVEKTGDLQFAEQNIRNIGLAIQATGAAGQDIGEILAEFQKMDIKSPDQVLAALDTLNRQGKEGAFTLQNLARLGPRVITAYTSTGRGGAEALREMGAALQVIRMGTGNAEQAATAWEATLRTLTDPEKLKKLSQVGIQVFDPQQLEEGKRVLRPINELMEEIIQASRGDKVKLGKIFDAEAIRAFNQAAAEFQRTGRLDSLDRFMDIHGDGAATIRDSARAADDASAALTNLFTAWKRFADAELTGPMQDLTDLVNSLDAEDMAQVMQALKWGGAAFGGAILARKVGGAVGAVGGMMRGRRGGAGDSVGDLLGGLASAGKPIPVYVVNDMGGRGKGGRGGAPGGAARRGGRGPASAPGETHRRLVRERLAAEREQRSMRKFRSSRWLGGSAHEQAVRYRRGGAITRGAMRLGATAVGATTMVGAAGAAGYGTGKVIYDAIDETSFADKLGGTIATVLARLGNDEAQEAIDRRLATPEVMPLTVRSDDIAVRLQDEAQRVRPRGIGSRLQEEAQRAERRPWPSSEQAPVEVRPQEVLVRLDVGAEKDVTVNAREVRGDDATEVELTRGVRAGGVW